MARAPATLRGSVLVTGHTVSTGGAALDRLEALRPGDAVTVRTRRDVLEYAVRRVAVIDKGLVARRAERLFSQEVPGRLVLITCGDWDGTRHRSNVVVTAQPTGSSTLKAFLRPSLKAILKAFLEMDPCRHLVDWSTSRAGDSGRFPKTASLGKTQTGGFHMVRHSVFTSMFKLVIALLTALVFVGIGGVTVSAGAHDCGCQEDNSGPGSTDSGSSGSGSSGSGSSGSDNSGSSGPDNSGPGNACHDNSGPGSSGPDNSGPGNAEDDCPVDEPDDGGDSTDPGNGPSSSSGGGGQSAGSNTVVLGAQASTPTRQAPRSRPPSTPA